MRAWLPLSEFSDLGPGPSPMWIGETMRHRAMLTTVVDARFHRWKFRLFQDEARALERSGRTVRNQDEPA
jgi:hypothetical protein